MAEVSITTKGWPKRRNRMQTSPSAPAPIPAPPGLDQPAISAFSVPAPAPAPVSISHPATPADDVDLQRIIEGVRKEYLAAKEVGCSIDVKISRVGHLDSVDVVEDYPWRRCRPREPGVDEDVFVGTVRDESKMKGWKKLKNGITMDSGSAVDITPEDENPEFPIVELTGSRRGRRLGAANGTPIEISGEKWISFSTKEGWDLEWPFIAGKVKKTLKSVGTTCDADNYVLFRKTNGYIVHEADKAFIEFDRVGNVYVIDVWIRIGSKADEAMSGFARQARVR
jgi:hypothetical protein